MFIDRVSSSITNRTRGEERRRHTHTHTHRKKVEAGGHISSKIDYAARDLGADFRLPEN